MRKATYFAMTHTEALTLLDRAPTMHLASTGDAGQPILRALHTVRVGGALYFHGAPVGEKAEALGRRAVLSYEEDVARIPSTFTDPVRACPATTLYRSVQVEGVLGAEHEPAKKAAVLTALMEKLQPEGGYAPIDAEGPLYAKAVASIAVVRLDLEQVTGKQKLAQNRTPDERAKVIRGLLGRGDPGDYAAVEAILDANPGDARPDLLRARDGSRVLAHLPDERLEEAARLLEGAYWLEGVSPSDRARAFRDSAVRVGVLDDAGGLVAVARATTDGRVAWIFDVLVTERARGRGLASAMLRVLLAHPRVGGARIVRLGTRDARPLYERFGFVDVREAPLRAYPVVEMALRPAGVPPLAPAAHGAGGSA